MPSAPAKTFAEPPGTTPSIGLLGRGPPRRMPFTTSFTVPSPPWAMTRSNPSSAAALLAASAA